MVDAVPMIEEAVQRSLRSRESAVRAEVQRLLDATLTVIRRNGTDTPPRVADIVAEAGVSNQAFYRHFASRDDLLAAVAEAGGFRLVSYLEHQMAKESEPREQVARWVEGVLSQAEKPDIARDTRAVVASRHAGGPRTSDSARVAVEKLLIDPLAGAGSTDPERDAAVIAAAVFARLEYHLWMQPPTKDDVQHILSFCLTGAGFD